MILKGLACAGREVLDRLEHAAIFLLPDHDALGRSLLGDFDAAFELVVQQGRARLLPAVAADQRVARGGEQIAFDIVDRRAQLRRLQAQKNLLHQRSEEHTSELQSLMRNSYAVFCLKKKTSHKQKK